MDGTFGLSEQEKHKQFEAVRLARKKKPKYCCAWFVTREKLDDTVHVTSPVSQPAEHPLRWRRRRNGRTMGWPAAWPLVRHLWMVGAAVLGLGRPPLPGMTPGRILAIFTLQGPKNWIALHSSIVLYHPKQSPCLQLRVRNRKRPTVPPSGLVVRHGFDVLPH